MGRSISLLALIALCALASLAGCNQQPAPPKQSAPIAEEPKDPEAKITKALASLSDADRNLLTDWLASKFGPDSKPFPRTYVPPEITTFFSDPEAYRLMNRACTKCHGIDRVQGARKAESPYIE